MLKFNIIIPLDMSNDADADSDVDEKSKSHGDMPTLNLSRQFSPTKSSASYVSSLLQDQCVQGGNTYFLVPALIDLAAEPLIPKVAPSGQIKFEKTFRLENFFPPGLLQRIMSRTYFRYGNRHNVRESHPYAVHTSNRQQHHMSYQRSVRNCWKSAFLQSFYCKDYGEISVWVWIEKGPENQKNEKVRIDSGSTNKKSKSYNCKSNPQIVETRGTVHISVFGNIFVCQELLKKLNFYSDIVSEVLTSFRSLCHVTQAMVCPVCSMEERRADYGEFSQRDLREVSAELRKISQAKAEATSRSQSGHTSENEGRVSFEWAKTCRQRCPRQGCVVNPDYLVLIPPNLIRDSLTQSPLDQAQTTISFLMEEIVRLSSKPSADILNSVCKVGIGFCKKERFVNFKNGDCTPLLLHFPKLKHLATGAVLDICSSGGARAQGSGDKDLCGDDIFVVTCEHLMQNPKTKELFLTIPESMVPVYLVGGEP
mgnify:CR=1 FL=1